MIDNTCNGWKNYPTWRINLEICDDLTSTLANEVRDGDIEPFEDVVALADWLSDEVDDVLTNYGENEEGLAIDYARAFVSQVDFYEIATNLIADDAHIIASTDDSETCPTCSGVGELAPLVICPDCHGTGSSDDKEATD